MKDEQEQTTKYLMEKLEGGAKAIQIRFDEHNLIVDLQDGRSLSVPLLYYPRLYHATPAEREKWVLEGEGIYWAELDEDIRPADLLIGLPSGESQESLKKWLLTRQTIS